MPRPKNTEVRVYVVEYGRERLMLRIKWPDGRIEHETTTATTRQTAEKIAAVREAELRKLGPKTAGKMLWTEFRKDIENRHIAALAEKTRSKYRTVFNAMEKHCDPPLTTVGQLTTSYVATFIANWRSSGVEDTTIASSLNHLRFAVKWAEQMKYLDELPIIRKPTIDDEDATRGRAVTPDEFQRIIRAIPDVVKEQAPHWERLIRGLYLSGLRLGEALNLTWDQPGTMRVDLSGGYPMIDIPRKTQKRRKAQLWPIVEDFASFLNEVPTGERTGFVFQCPPPVRSKQYRRVDTVSKYIILIGKAAEVIVSHAPVKYASAHDLRRSFGVKWAEVLMPDELQVLMRHRNIATTMKFYTRRNAESLAARIWQKGKITGNTGPPHESASDKKS